jgi:hypothetical protein
MPPLLDETSGPEGEHISISRIALNAKETADFRAATKRHGVTVTQAFTALLALADFETTLRLAVSADPDVYEKTATTYEQATHVLFAFYFISHVRPSRIRAVPLIPIRTDSVSSSPSSIAASERVRLPRCAPWKARQWCSTSRHCGLRSSSTKSRRP